VIVEFPSDAGAEKLTLAWASPAVAETLVGAPGSEIWASFIDKAL
jgi:hypothetical protein